MANAPENRYASVDALLADVNAYLNGFAPQAETASFFKQLWLLVKRNRVSSAVLAVSGLTLLGLTAVFVHNIEAARNLAESSEAALRKELERRPEFYMYQAIAADDRGDFDLSFEMANLAVSLNPNLKEVYRVLGHGHFIRCNFAASAHAYEKFGSSNPGFVRMQNLAVETAQKQSAGRDLSEPEFLDLLARLKLSDAWIVDRIVNRHVAKNLSLEDRLVFARGYIQLMNPKYPLAEFQFRDDLLDLGTCQDLNDGRSLQFFPAHILAARSGLVRASQLNGMPLEELRFSNSWIPDFRGWSKFTSLRRIELRNCPIDELSPIYELPHLEELDLRQSKFKDLSPLCRCPSLKKLTLSPGFDPKQLGKLRKEVELIISD